MLRIGCHISAAKGYRAMAADALRIDANTFQFFTRNPRGAKAKALDEADVAAFRETAAAHDIAPIIAHASYTLNACAKDEHLLSFSREIMADDLARLEYTPGNFYNFHPGSHGGEGIKKGIDAIAETLNTVMRAEMRTTVLLETMAGKGSEVGGSFEELRAILERVTHRAHMGVCLDTCHVWDGGYDVVNDLDGVLAHFDAVIGLPWLKAVHLNGSLHPCGARKDRHARIGEGHIGLDAMQRIINHPALRTLPFVLETPNELDGHGEEIALLNTLYEGG